MIANLDVEVSLAPLPLRDGRHRDRRRLNITDIANFGARRDGDGYHLLRLLAAR